MATKKRGLGKGLNELLAATLEVPPVAIKEEAKEISALQYLPLDKVVTGPFQPRQHIRSSSLEELAESIRAQGILQPIVVREKGEQFEIVAGERRWRAAQLVGLETIPVLIRNLPDNVAMAMALIENIQRENLNPIEEAFALKRLSEELELTHLQVAEAIGKSRVSVTNFLRLLTLNKDVQKALEEGQLEMGHARALLGLKGEFQNQVAQIVIEKGLSVRETEKLVNHWQEGKENNRPLINKSPDANIERLEENLADKLGAKVNIRHNHKGKGMLVIHYHTLDELDGILAHIK